MSIMLFDNLPGSLPSVCGRRDQAGRGHLQASELAELPDVPAMSEFLPGLRDDIVDHYDGSRRRPRRRDRARINALTVTALVDNAVKKRYAELRRHGPADDGLRRGQSLSRQGRDAATADHEGRGHQAGVRPWRGLAPSACACRRRAGPVAPARASCRAAAGLPSSFRRAAAHGARGWKGSILMITVRGFERIDLAYLWKALWQRHAPGSGSARRRFPCKRGGDCDLRRQERRRGGAFALLGNRERGDRASSP